MDAKEVISCRHAKFTNGGGDSATHYYICEMNGKVTDPAKCSTCRALGRDKTLTDADQEKIIQNACRRAGLYGHVKWLQTHRDAHTWAEKIAYMYRKPGYRIMPTKGSVMYCETLDMCFFFMYGKTPAMAYAGYMAAGGSDNAEKLATAFKKGEELLRFMQEEMEAKA